MYKSIQETCSFVTYFEQGDGNKIGFHCDHLVTQLTHVILTLIRLSAVWPPKAVSQFIIALTGLSSLSHVLLL